MRSIARLAVVVALCAVSGCALPYFTSSHVDPKDGEWVVVVAHWSNDAGPVQYRLDEAPPEVVLPELVRSLAARHGGYATCWVASPDGRRFAAEEHWHADDYSTRERLVVADAGGSSWTVRDLPQFASPLAWTPDGRRLLCSVSQQIAPEKWRRDFAVFDVDGGTVRRYDVDHGDWLDPCDVAISPDGRRVAYPTKAYRVGLLDLESGAVSEAALPENGERCKVLGWLDDGRIAYCTPARRVLFARPGDANAEDFPTNPGREWPVSARPDGGAVLCSVERTPMFGIYVRRGALVRWKDGGREDLDSERDAGEFWGGIGVWLRAPGMPGSPIGSEPRRRQTSP